MMSSDDDDAEPQLKAVENYYFVDDDDAPISFDVLPIQFDMADEVPSFKKDVYLRGFTDGGLQKVYKQVVAWKLGLAGRSPEITVLSTEGSWIVLLKPRPSYEETIRSVLITVEMLHFLRRRPTDSEKNIWDHLQGVFDKFAVRPSEDDFRNHQLLIKLFAERDPSLANSQILQGFIKDKTLEKTDEIGSNNLEVKQPSIPDDEDSEEMVEDDSKHEPKNDNDEDDEEDEDLFDSVCAICDNGGELLCCEGPCMRSFHAKIVDGEDSYCATLGYTKTEVKAIQNFLCKNCEHKKHQCFVCGELGPSDGPNAKVFLCNNATCGHFYHTKCVAQLLHPNNRNEASELEKKIVAGFSFTCPVHWCFCCKGLEDRTQEPLQFAVCRRCPRSYHRKCLPREISFEDIDEKGIITRAWELSKRILIYCLDHDIDLDIGTPSRDHIKFPPVEKSANSVKKKVKELAEKKKRTFYGSHVDEPFQKAAEFPDKFIVQDGEKARRAGMKSSFKQDISEPEKKRAKYQKETSQLQSCLVECAADASSPKQPGKEQEQELGALSSPVRGKPLWSSFPIVDSETEKRVKALVEKENSSVTLEDVSRRCVIPSTYASSGRQIDKIIALGKLERSVQAVHAALQKLENGGTVNDAKAVCEPEVLRQLTRWNNKFRVYLAPFIHGMRYTSFGRHFTKKEKLTEIVDRLHWYVQPGDTIADFSCGLNDFSQFMKEKLDKVGKKCNFKNYDVIRPKNSFCFEKRDWMTVHPKELPHGSKLIMGLNPPFGLKAMLANKFIDKALTFKPKLIILIVPKEAERLDRKRQPYDLVWEDSHILSGKSFYLPGSLDVSDKQIDQWNASPPPLYLWSRSDWTKKHKKIAGEHGHTETLKAISHAKHEVDYLSGELPVQNHGEVTNEPNSVSGKERGRYVDGNMTFVTGKLKQVNRLPSEKQVEIAYEETKVASGKIGSCQADDRRVHHEQRNAHSDFKIYCYNDNRKVLDVSNGSRGRNESEQTGVHDAKVDSDTSISPSDSGNSQHKSRSYSPPIPSEIEYSSERMALQDNYLNNRVPEPCTAPLERAPCNNSYFRNVDQYGVASVENHFYSTDNVDTGSRNYSPNLEEQTGLFAGDQTGGSFYRSQNFEDYSMDYTMDSAGSAQRNLVPSRDVQENARTYSEHITNDDPRTAMGSPTTDIRAQIRMYGGHTRDDHPQTAMDPPARDIRAQIRMYGGQNIHDHHLHTSRFSSGSLDARFEEPTSSTYGIPSLGSTRRSAIDKYTPYLDETNYTSGPRDTYNAPVVRRDVPPDPGNFASRHQYPYPHPGSGGWLG